MSSADRDARIATIADIERRADYGSGNLTGHVVWLCAELRAALSREGPIDHVPDWPHGICAGCGNPLGEHTGNVCPTLREWRLEWRRVEPSVSLSENG